MGGMIKEYGKLIVVVLLIVSLFGFVVGSGSNSLRGRLYVAKPRATTKNENNINQLVWISKREAPILTIKSEKLREGESYQFTEFVEQAIDMEGEPLNVRITKFTDKDGMIYNESVLTVQKGFYNVTYQIEDAYHLKTTKTMCFVVD